MRHGLVRFIVVMVARFVLLFYFSYVHLPCSFCVCVCLFFVFFVHIIIFGFRGGKEKKKNCCSAAFYLLLFQLRLKWVTLIQNIRSSFYSFWNKKKKKNTEFVRHINTQNKKNILQTSFISFLRFFFFNCTQTKNVLLLT